ncbi:NB-ARC domain-containing disease resistance protein [Artemisia annua]|uniref:NB-ARC domain-containing disease resistance protein n=1 Tax=Artemisia annua TaxID=35608 RepID=A0A2U1N767_ARTAN|nr:NB-ARC domain-containing disease resistance protein [Artemisia annua]
MAIEAVASVVLQKLTDMLEEQLLTQNKVIVYEVQEIIKSLNSMRDLMISIKEIKQQAEEYLDSVYMVEDGIEKFTLNAVRRRKVFGLLTNHIFFFNNLNSCRHIHQNIQKIITQLMKLRDHEYLIIEVQNKHKNEEENLDENHNTQSTNHLEELSFCYSCNEDTMQIVGIKECFQQTKQMSRFSYKEEELGIFGLKEDVNTLVNHLVTDNSQHVVSIVGLGDIGKTTLARTIYKSRDIKRHFQFRAWVSKLDDYFTKDVLLNLLKATGSMTDKSMNMDDEKALKFKLSTFLKNKRYLVILDGVSTCNIWEDLKDIFPDVKNGSKLVLTSSQTMETTEVSLFLHRMMPLSEDDSWEMFKKNVGLLKTKDPSSWSQVFYSEENCLNVLSLCFRDLSDHLKVCLLYSVLFPKHFDIPVRRLLCLWVAEGFVKHTSTKSFPDDTAETYFEELVNRNMFQISKLRSDNSPRRCRVLGVVHDFLLPKAKKTNLFYTYCKFINFEEVECPKNEQGIDKREVTKKENAAYPPLSRYLTSFEIETPNSFSPKKSQPKSYPFNPVHLGSYMSFNHKKTGYRQANQIGSFLGNIINSGIGLLRVLDLEGVYKPILPENLGNLCNLRYLGLRSTYLDSLPPSVGELTHLETLDMKHTCIDELPGSICRLKKLRHLNLNEMILKMEPHSSLRLLTLSGLFLNEKVPIKDGLDKLHDLRELGITFHLRSNQKDMMDWIANFNDLRSLRLRSKDELGRPSKLTLRSMLKLMQLSHLNLLGHLEKLPSQNDFPPTLKVLTLSISLLKQDPMETLGQLPCLTVLRLLGDSYIGKEMVCRKGGFSKLRELKLWMLKELESWYVEEGSMVSLKHVEIRCCEKLHNIPTTLLQKKQLENLVVTGMPRVFTTEIECLISDHTSMTINQWI